MMRGEFTKYLWPVKRDKCGWFRHRLALFGWCEHKIELVSFDQWKEEWNDSNKAALAEIEELAKQPLFNIRSDDG